MISTHILDTSVGYPAAGVKVTLEILSASNSWQELAIGETNSDGRHAFDIQAAVGKYRINFFTEEYFEKKKTESFFLETPVAFNITDTSRNYHVPLLLNPFGYSTYRGS
jgi:5-hydroxyisourate hydrolase